MIEDEYKLTPKGLALDLRLPFLLIWYGWLSEQQGQLAKQHSLAIEVQEDNQSGPTLRLTRRGTRRLKDRWYAIEQYERGYVFAWQLRNEGLVSPERHYRFHREPVGQRANYYDPFIHFQARSDVLPEHWPLRNLGSIGWRSR